MKIEFAVKSVRNCFGNEFIRTSTKRWVNEIYVSNPKLYHKLAQIGFVEQREACGTLGELIERFLKYPIRGRFPKERTTRNRQVVGNMLVNIFACQPVGNFKSDSCVVRKVCQMPVKEITKEKADSVFDFMLNTYQPTTWGRRIRLLKAMFEMAVTLGWIEKNPFGHLYGSCDMERNRFYFIEKQEAEQVLKACPDTKTRLIFALGRWGGLRIPSELSQLKRSEIDWENGKFLVSIPKMTGKVEQEHGNYKTRWIPIFPEIQPYLRQYLSETEGTSDFIFPEIDGSDRSGAILRKQFSGIMKRANLRSWPKFFVNLRSTRDTELQNTYPLYQVCYWLGHTAQTSLKHYTQLTDNDFRAASSPSVEPQGTLGAGKERKAEERKGRKK